MLATEAVPHEWFDLRYGEIGSGIDVPGFETKPYGLCSELFAS